MTPGVQVLLSGALTFGVPLVLAAREIIVLRRGNRGGWQGDRPPEPKPGPPPPPSESRRPSLPDSLIPKPLSQVELTRLRAEQRILEPV
jgi:hypothetical protein